MKVLLYLTVISLCIAHTFGQFTCSTTNITSSNCGEIINGFISNGFSYFNLSQIPQFNISAMEEGLTTLFATIDASPLCSNCVSNLKAFYCLMIYPECVPSGTYGNKPAIPCNDAACNAIANCAPGVFVNTSSIYVPQLASIPFATAYAGYSTNIISNAPTFFGLPLDNGCAGQDSVATVFNAIFSDDHVSCSSLTANYSTFIYETETCPCMDFPNASVSYCTQADIGFTQIASIYSLLNVTAFDEQVQSYAQGNISALAASGLSCPSCDDSLKTFFCTTAFLTCNPGPNSFFNFLAPCVDVGENFVSACSLSGAYKLLSTLNPNPTPEQQAQLITLSTYINQSLSLPDVASGYCQSPTFTSDANCGCQPLRSSDYCYNYNITSTAFYVPLDIIDNATRTNLQAFQPLLDIYASTCPTCASRISSALCHAIYGSCDASSTFGTRCTTSCVAELVNCKADEICGAFELESLFSSDGTCVAYTSGQPAPCSSPLLPPFVQPCQDQSAIVSNDSLCTSFVGNSLSPLTLFDPVTANSLNINEAISNASPGLCSNCKAALTELLCNMKYLNCTAYPKSQDIPISLNLPQWGCDADLNSEFEDCAPLPYHSSPGTLQQYVDGFSAGFSANGVNLASVFKNASILFQNNAAALEDLGITYTCNAFHTINNRSQVDICPCVNMTAIGTNAANCSKYINYDVSIMLGAADIAPSVVAGILADPNLLNLAAFSCPNCADKAIEFACLSAFPMCMDSVGYIPVNKSVCNNALATCRAGQFNDPEVAEVLSLLTLPQVKALVGEFPIPNITAFVDACGLLPEDGFVPDNYAPKSQCDCAPIPDSSGCSGIIERNIVPFLGTLDDATRQKLEGAIFGLGMVETGCVNCQKAVKRNLCTMIYPTCTPDKLIIRNCKSDCESSVAFCDKKDEAQGICDDLLSSALSTDPNICIPLESTASSQNNCQPPANSANTILPSLFLIALALFIKVLF